MYQTGPKPVKKKNLSKSFDFSFYDRAFNFYNFY